MDGDWDEVGRIAFPAPASSDFPRPASTLAFDTSQELLWTGTDRGQVVSFAFAPNSTDLQRYTSFRIHPPNDGPVRQFLFNERGVICLGPRSIHLMMRRGLVLWSIRHENMIDLRCMSFTSKGTAEILVAGWQDTMFVIDVNKGEILKQMPTEHHYNIMCKSRYVCAATKTGAVDLLDPVTLRVTKTWQAHVAYINDMDAQNDFIVTCGGSLKQQAAQTYMLDPYVNVFDLKNMLSLSPIPFPPLAAHVRMHPRMLTTSIVVSQAGQMHVVDIMNPNTTNVRYANVLSSVGMVEIAPSGEALVLTDADCNIHLWGSPAKIHFVDFATPIEVADPAEPAAPLDWSVETPLNSVGMPYYREKLLSAWPPNLVYRVGAPPAPLDPAFLATLQKTDWGMYGRRPRGAGKSQSDEAGGPTAARVADSLQIPKFLSDQARESAMSSSSLEPPAEINKGNFGAEAVPSPDGELESLKPEAPPMYRSLEIKYSKFGVDDFDFRYYNKTQYAGLENHITNSYANSLLQVMNYTPLLRNLALQHAATACPSDPCLLCELGFVFDMLQKAEGLTCHATNLLKALSNSPSAGQRGLLEEEPRGQSLTSMMQGLTSFILERMNHEYRNIPPASTALEESLFGLRPPVNPDLLLSKVLATSAVRSINCSNCRNELTAPLTNFVNSLIYPTQKTATAAGVATAAAAAAARGGRANRVTFSQVLKTSIERETTPKGWCNRCQRYQILQQRHTIHSVPAVLTLNAAVESPENARLWASPGWLPEEIGIIVDQGQFFCYEGEDLKLHLQRGIHQIAVYSLIGVIVNIESDQPPPQKSHLVAMVNVAHAGAAAAAAPDSTSEQSQSRWHIFNDFSVRPVSSAEALTFNPAWKMPSALTYQLKAANNKGNMDWKARLDTSILFKDTASVPGVLMRQIPRPGSGVNGTGDLADNAKTYRILNPAAGEFPGPDTIVALDTEFVSLKQPEIQMNSDGERETIRPMSHALARVSVVRGMGEYEGLPFIDDYIAIKEPIVDYLTLYSGIRADDLDPRTSRHNLVSLKTTYKKLWVLLNLGCRFLGHGLKQDFRVINMQVPRAQVIDTIDLFYVKSRLRKLSLAFLAWCLLREDIQLETHDSIEDARTALKLYRKFLEFKDAGILDAMLQDVYRTGRETNFKPPRRDDQVVQRTDTPPIPLEGGPGPGPGPSTPARNTKSAAGGASGAGMSGQVQGSSGGGLGVASGGWTPGKGSPLRD